MPALDESVFAQVQDKAVWRGGTRMTLSSLGAVLGLVAGSVVRIEHVRAADSLEKLNLPC